MPNKSGAISLDSMLQKDRRQRAQSSNVPTGPRGGNTKHHSGSGIGKPGSASEGRWAHDLHHRNNPLASRISKADPRKIGKSNRGRSKSPTRSKNPLMAAVTPAVAASLSGNRLFAALHGEVAITPAQASTVNVQTPGGNSLSFKGASRSSGGLSIKGAAGPFVVRAQNFAPGTTAEDIKTALTPIGKITSCIILTASPTVMAEIVFEKRESADKCINQYNNQIADGRRLHLYMHEGAPIGRPTTPGSKASADQAASRAEADRIRRLANQQANLARNIVDGTQGFKAPMLYSDQLITRRGRGFDAQ